MKTTADVRFTTKNKIDSLKRVEETDSSPVRRASPRKPINPKLLITKISKKLGWTNKDELNLKADDSNKANVARTEVNLQAVQQRPHKKKRTDSWFKTGVQNGNQGLITPIPKEKNRGNIGGGNERQGRSAWENRDKGPVELSEIPRSISPINLESRRLSRNKHENPQGTDKLFIHSRKVPSEVIDYLPDKVE